MDERKGAKVRNRSRGPACQGGGGHVDCRRVSRPLCVEALVDWMVTKVVVNVELLLSASCGLVFIQFFNYLFI